MQNFKKFPGVTPRTPALRAGEGAKKEGGRKKGKKEGERGEGE